MLLITYNGNVAAHGSSRSMVVHIIGSLFCLKLLSSEPGSSANGCKTRCNLQHQQQTLDGLQDCAGIVF